MTWFEKNHDGTAMFLMSMPPHTDILVEELDITQIQAASIFSLIQAIFPNDNSEAECEVLGQIATEIVIQKHPVNDVIMACLTANLPHIITNNIKTRF